MTVAEPVADGEALGAGVLALGAGVPGDEVALCGVAPPPDPPPEHAAARMATTAMAQQAAPRRATQLTGLMQIVSLG